ncbi:MAG: large subunit ribosomal protein L25 [Parcubacteria group bacterium Athens0714_12]|nr:MAG: large subunit ribosomal protein L25 [Parcubacteria group bacterium Athens0714_12]
MELNAAARIIKGKNVKTLRKKNIIPAVLYGHKVEPKILQVNFLDFKKIYEEAGENTIIDLKIDDKESVKALIYDIKKDYLSNVLNHIDFYQIKKGEKVNVEVELEFVGESKAVKELKGVLVKNLNKIKIECLPENLIHNIKVDISKLNTFEDSIKVKDLAIPEKIKVLEKEDETVVLVLPPRAEEVKVEAEVVEEVKAEATEEKTEEKKEAEPTKKDKK